MAFIRDIFKNPPENNLAFYLKALADDLVGIINRRGLTVKDNLPFDILEKTVSSGVAAVIDSAKIPVIEGISIVDTGGQAITSFKTVRVNERQFNVVVTFSAPSTARVKFLIVGQ
jgi:hypothetical protein